MDNNCSKRADPEPLSLGQDITSSPYERSLRSYPATTHAAVLCAFVLPFAMIPYIAARRHTAKVARTVKGLNNELQHLKNELNAAASRQKELQSELRNLKTPIADTSKHLRDMREQVSRWETHSAGVEQAIQTDLRRLLNEVQHSRTQTDALRSLGMSLVDMAAFMEEVELEFGLDRGRLGQEDRRGVEKLRLLALRMQSLPQFHEERHL